VNYPIVIHKDRHSDYGVTVPDLPGCFSAGKSMDQALTRAREAVALYLEVLIEDGQPIPPAGAIEDHRKNPDFAGGTWAVVGIDVPRILKAKRINISMPERVLEAVDRFARERGETRSGLLVQAVTEYMGKADQIRLPRRHAPSARPRKRVRQAKARYTVLRRCRKNAR
jgi:predicted RNase H-like HicB family nuclease